MHVMASIIYSNCHPGLSSRDNPADARVTMRKDVYIPKTTFPSFVGSTLPNWLSEGWTFLHVYGQQPVHVKTATFYTTTQLLEIDIKYIISSMSTAGPSNRKRRNSAQSSPPPDPAPTSPSQPQSIPRVELEELLQVLDWSPPRLTDERIQAEARAPKKAARSTSTRPPGFYDRHLCDEQILKKLIHLPTLTDDLLNVVSDYLELEDGTPRKLPPRHGFTSTAYLNTLATKNPHRVCSEEGVRSKYMMHISTPLVPIASTLALDLEDWNQHFLSFEPSAIKQKYAIADGFLKIRLDEDEPPLDTLWTERMSWVAESFPNVAVWEFKSLTAATSNDFEDIIRLSRQDRDFPWQKCNAPNLCKNHFQPDGTETRTTFAMGLDSTETICKLYNDQPRANTGENQQLNMPTRKTSSLYISNIVEVPQRGYVRLQVGLYLAIFRDVVNRAVQLKIPGLPPDSWRRFHSDKPGKATKGKKRRLTEAVRLQQQADARRAAFQQEKAVLLWTHKGGNFLPGNKWGPFTRENDAPPSTIPGNLFIELCFDEIAACVYDATVRFNTIQWDKKLVLKWGHNDDDYEKLRKELESYEQLKIHDVLDTPALIGSFKYDQTPELRHRVLLMENIGVTLRKRGEGVPMTNRLAFVRLLSNLHNAGYLHGNLTEKSLLYGGGRVRFVGFGMLKQIESEEEKVHEHNVLSDLLNVIDQDHRHEKPKRQHTEFQLAVVLGPIEARISQHLKEIKAQIAINDFVAEAEEAAGILIIRYVEGEPEDSGGGVVSHWISRYVMQNLPHVPYHFCFS
ncbi:hypothetical protein Hypma_003544 [Hypsizygus marmoreus]|uniref:Protein kinase domain-containing protein n=1 Tax=Hypsizygus marmoreus TaxID=39966 RepID=A0A369J1N1_HYPMA|nr:hypothetical protein Hypma_003544 [Hypsizygus marmoreus]